VSFVFVIVVPGDPTSPQSAFGLQWFSDRHVDILRRRIIADDKAKQDTHRPLTKREFFLDRERATRRLESIIWADQVR
jgi:hypothetical protein